MKYGEFYFKYSKAGDEQEKKALIDKVISKHYLPFSMKKSTAMSVISNCCFDANGNYKISSPDIYFYFAASVISKYTRIEFDEQDTLSMFDKLSECHALQGIFSAIGSDVNDFNTLLTMCVNDARQNYGNRYQCSNGSDCRID